VGGQKITKKKKKKNEANIQPSWPDKLVNNGFNYILFINLSYISGHSGYSQEDQQDSASLPARLVNNSAGFGLSCPLEELAV